MIMFHYIVTYIYISVYTCMYILTNYNADYIYLYVIYIYKRHIHKYIVVGPWVFV